jgi:site-specific DNA-cytosine methylase
VTAPPTTAGPARPAADGTPHASLGGGEEGPHPGPDAQDDERDRGEQKNDPIRLLDLCSGCGGNAIAAKSISNMEIVALVEKDQGCAKTLTRNGFKHVICDELQSIDYSSLGRVDVITGGLPCQPHSIGGQNRGEDDPRNLWSHAIKAVQALRPKAFVFETAAGLLSPAHTEELRHTLDALSSTGLVVEAHRVNALDYGVAQNRVRCLITGVPASFRMQPPLKAEQLTIREALKDTPEDDGYCRTTSPNREYPGHTANDWDRPAKTIVAGTHGTGGGNHLIRDQNTGQLRQFTVRELARLQGFPDHYSFDPVWSKAVREIGNACPPPLMRAWLLAVTTHVARAEEERSSLITSELTRRKLITDELWSKCLSLRISLMSEADIIAKDKEAANAKKLRELVVQAGLDRSLTAIAQLAGATSPSLLGDELDERLEAKSGPPVSRSKCRAARRRAEGFAVELEKTVSSLRAEHSMMAALTLEHDTPGRTSLDDEQQVPDITQAAVYGDDGQPVGTPDPRERRIFFRMPAKALLGDYNVECDDQLLDFFELGAGRDENDSTLPVDDALDPRYMSMQADLEFLGGPDAPTTLRVITDSGAARCGIKASVLKKKFPNLANTVVPSTLKFRDASGRRMPLEGQLLMTFLIGGVELTARVYVFTELASDFLLGTNAIVRNGIIIDGHHRRIYTHKDRSLGEPLITGTDDLQMEPVCECHTEAHCADDACGDGPKMICDRDAGCVRVHLGVNELTVDCAPGPVSLGCARQVPRLVLRRDVSIPAGETVLLDPKLVGAPPTNESTLEFTAPATILGTGLSYSGGNVVGSLQNTKNDVCPLHIHNPTSAKVSLKSGTTVGVGRTRQQEDTVLMAAVIRPQDDHTPLRGIDDGGIEDLRALGFSLDNSIDPDERRADGTYAPLSDRKKRILYEIALRWHQAWSRDAKVPKVSYLVIIDIPTGDAPPQSQSPYPIPTKLRDSAMAEIDKLLQAGLIEPSMSDWASPALVRVKKDSTADDIKIKFAIDYRRVNAVTTTDAGGLGTQADILYGVGGKYKFLGLCDAAGGFYQFMLSPRDCHKSAFILPASMGGTLFQWRVAPYGLTRNPAGYSRGMQWVLKGLHSLPELDFGRAKGGATSWLDDICMRATSFTGFYELFERVLSRVACAGMTLKGSKCELLLPAMDILGFVATPHGLMLQKPKLEGLMRGAVPSNPTEAMKFLGGVAFIRRAIPRSSLLSAPMTAAIKSGMQRQQAGRSEASRRHKPTKNEFNEHEQECVRQSYYAIMEHLNSDVVLAAPDFDDPWASFVICTDASDFAIGGVLMQWQHPSPRGPGPPHNKDDTRGELEPLSARWRVDAGWELKVIGYHSKTLNDAQKNYPAFDKEAGAILLCIRHWSDLITYHPTTVYTDSAVATSMLTKHSAPTRLQRWGVELGTYLPHLKISHRKGAENGLADLLSRFPAFEKFITVREDIAELPDDLFDYIGDAPLFLRSPGRQHTEREAALSNASYKLYDSKSPTAVPTDFWCINGAPEIPGRGSSDRMATDEKKALDASMRRESATVELAALMEDDSIHANKLESVLDVTLSSLPNPDDDDRGAVYTTDEICMMYEATHRRPPRAYCHIESNLCTEAIATLNVELVDDPDLADILVFDNEPPDRQLSDHRQWLSISSNSPDAPNARIGGAAVRISASQRLDLPEADSSRGYYAPPTRLRTAVLQLLATTLKKRFGVTTGRGATADVASMAAEVWRPAGLCTRPTTAPSSTAWPEAIMDAYVKDMPAIPEALVNKYLKPPADVIETHHTPREKDVDRTPSKDVDGPLMDNGGPPATQHAPETPRDVREGVNGPPYVPTPPRPDITPDVPLGGGEEERSQSNPEEEPQPDSDEALQSDPEVWETERDEINPDEEDAGENPETTRHRGIPTSRGRRRTATTARAHDWEARPDKQPGSRSAAVDKIEITLERQKEDPELRLITERIKLSSNAAIKDYYELHPDGLYRLVVHDGEVKRAICVPRHMRAAILGWHHYSLMDGTSHSGGTDMYEQMRSNYYWDGMSTECDAFVAACKTCGERRSQAPIGAAAATAPTPDYPFQVVHIDHKSGLPMSNGYTSVLVVVCALTRFTIYIPVRDLRGTTSLRALIDDVFSIFGVPLVIISDNGKSFANHLMTAAEKLYGYRQIFVMPHTPQANGLAEAAVKKLKILLDRNTHEYKDWAPFLKPFQAAINQHRRSDGLRETPFRALFGRSATPLAALENPRLLPNGSLQEEAVQNFATRLSNLQERLRLRSDGIKSANAAAAQKPDRRVRKVQVGDRIWLSYSDSERARYLRKHGHGKAWRHPYIVKEVRPHKVLLEVPTDGSVPEVLPWQSLRKCTFAAPHDHSDDLPTPQLAEGGLPLAEAPDQPEPGAEDPVNDPMGWIAWGKDKTQTYVIEKIVSAEKSGSGWRLDVKWQGYPETTKEALGTILKQTQHPDILADIERCKANYLLLHPTENEVERPEETARRQLPTRTRRRTVWFSPTDKADENVNPYVFESATIDNIMNVYHSPLDSLKLAINLRQIRTDANKRQRAGNGLLQDQLVHPRFIDEAMRNWLRTTEADTV